MEPSSTPPQNPKSSTRTLFGHWSDWAFLGVCLCVCATCSWALLGPPLPFVPTPPPFTPVTAAIPTDTPASKPTPTPTQPPLISLVRNDELINRVESEAYITAEVGTPALLLVDDFGLEATGRLHLLGGQVTLTEQNAQMQATLAGGSEAFVNTISFAGGGVFHFSQQPNVAFMGAGCFAASYPADTETIVLNCYRGLCQYVVAPSPAAPIALAAGQQVTLTLANMTTTTGPLLGETRARHRTALRQSTLGLEDKAVCLENRSVDMWPFVESPAPPATTTPNAPWATDVYPYAPSATDVYP